MKSLFAVLLLMLGFTRAASATVTIQFAEPFSGGIPSNLANAAGTITDGMRWGVVVDTKNDGFSNSGTSYDAYAGGVTTAGFLGANGVAGSNSTSTPNDYYIPGTLTQNGTTSGLQEGGGTVPGHGSILDDLTGISLTNGVAAGDKFALVWFATNSSAAGANYGFFTDPSFILPADGSTTDFSSPFVGNDPTRSASSTFAAVSGSPEPSRLLLVLFGSLTGLMARRRRPAV